MDARTASPPNIAMLPELAARRRDTHSEGFTYFVTSIAAPVASGWSGRRVGFAPTGKRRLVTAHTPSRH